MRSDVHSLSEEAREAAAAWCLRLSEGALDSSDHQSFQAWLESDPQHPALLERTVIAWSAIEDQALHHEMIRMRSEALGNVGRADRRRGLAAKVGWRLVAAIAACLLVLIGSGAWWRYMPTSYETGAGERRVVTLADGSSLSLDASTRVSVRYLSDRRQFWLKEGRAKFSVAKDPLKPFAVQTGRHMIVATGTQFSVEKLSGEVRVILYEGKVAVVETAQPDAKAVTAPYGTTRRDVEHALIPGRELVMADASNAARIVSVDTGQSIQWEAGFLEFSEEPLGVAIERMNRYGGAKLLVDDRRVARIPISGHFVGGDVDAFVESVTAIFPVQATRKADGTILLQANGS